MRLSVLVLCAIGIHAEAPRDFDRSEALHLVLESAQFLSDKALMRLGGFVEVFRQLDEAIILADKTRDELEHGETGGADMHEMRSKLERSQQVFELAADRMRDVFTTRELQALQAKAESAVAGAKAALQEASELDAEAAQSAPEKQPGSAEVSADTSADTHISTSAKEPEHQPSPMDEQLIDAVRSLDSAFTNLVAQAAAAEPAQPSTIARRAFHNWILEIARPPPADHPTVDLPLELLEEGAQSGVHESRRRDQEVQLIDGDAAEGSVDEGRVVEEETTTEGTVEDSLDVPENSLDVGETDLDAKENQTSSDTTESSLDSTMGELAHLLGLGTAKASSSSSLPAALLRSPFALVACALLLSLAIIFAAKRLLTRGQASQDPIHVRVDGYVDTESRMQSRTQSPTRTRQLSDAQPPSLKGRREPMLAV
jgi:hypothetical protein